jgi:amino-acid N-acetyltransferase
VPLRKATVNDVRGLHGLIREGARRHRVLARSLADLYDSLRDFWVWEEHGAVVGCAALHVSWEALGEVRSLVVQPQHRRRGLGKALVSGCVEEAHQLGLTRLFVLTYLPEFFHRLGFRPAPKSELPQKVWTDCVHCPDFPDCAEEALILEL